MTSGDRPPVVLVVDDDPALLTLLIRSGARFGYDVVAANDTHEAMDVVHARSIDVVVTDLEMPGGSGHGLIRQLRTERPQLPIVLMSGAGGVDDVVEGFRAGIADYLKKPFHPSDFSQSVRRALDWRAPGASTPSAVVVPAPPLSAEVAQASASSRDIEAAEIDVPEPLTVKLIELQEQPGLSGDVVVRVIERSQTIAARVLSLANSVYYRGQRPVTNLREAVVRLGNRTVLNLAVTLTHRGYYVLPNEAYTDLLSKLWSENVFVAALSREIARRGVGGDPEEVYLVALFHDIGEVVLVRQIAATGAPLDLMRISVTCETRHEEVGESVLSAWKLSSRLSRIAGNHHRLRSGRLVFTQVEEQIVHILAVADSVATERGRGTALRRPTDASASLAALGVTPRQLEPLIDRVMLLIGDEGR